MLYPLKFQPVFKDYIWGGRNLEKFGKELPPTGIVAESWEISCHHNGISVINNGEYAGTPLTEFLNRFGRELVGTALPERYLRKFPLLVKLIDANEQLSVQVHPSDGFAKIHEDGELGKNEMWHVLTAAPGAQLVYGLLPGVTREVFVQALQEHRLESCLKFVEVSPGDTFNIPAGLVHAIGKGIVLAEIQQNSDATYRVYDYNRVDKNGASRPLHLEKALQVIDFNAGRLSEKTEGLVAQVGNSIIKYLVANNYFAVELLNISGSLQQSADGDRFFLYIITEGQGVIGYRKGTVALKRGESVLIPAALGEYSLEGNFSALRGYIPDLEENIFGPLRKAGFADAEILEKISGLK
ncbi:MAG: type I phosphomannose isomerase catalytic subunit [Bacillota bacterium]